MKRDFHFLFLEEYVFISASQTESRRDSRSGLSFLLAFLLAFVVRIYFVTVRQKGILLLIAVLHLLLLYGIFIFELIVTRWDAYDKRKMDSQHISYTYCCRHGYDGRTVA